MSLHEECGVFGIYSPKEEDLASLCYYGLYALQHRGQESCGIVINHDGLFSSVKEKGLVSEVFTADKLGRLPKGSMAVAHARYGTTGGNTAANIQPMEVNHQKGRMALAHNGNLSNADALRDELELSGAIFHSTSDTETIAYMITRQRLKCGSIEAAVSGAMDIIEGAYSLILMSARKLILARDPHGFRPLCFGKTKDGLIVAASESCALHAVGAEFERDVEPGEIVVFSPEGMQSIRTHCEKKEKKLCIFEYIYFARPDSVIDGVSVHKARLQAGRELAAAHPVEADLVMGVPDSGLDAALGFSLASGIPYGIGLIKNKYIGRTFIAPDHRLDQVKIKLSAIKEAVEGKRIVLVDDSIVRGNTSGRIVALLREAGAKEVHMRISSPPFLHPCYYGTDVDSEDKLVAVSHTVEEIARMIGADSLGYLPVNKLGCLLLKDEAGRICPCSGYCDACFTGKYPTEIPQAGRKLRFELPLSER